MSFNQLMRLQVVAIVFFLILSVAYNINLLIKLKESNALLAEYINKQRGFREQVNSEDIERYINSTIEKELR